MSLEEYGSAMAEEAVDRFLERMGVGTLAFGSESGGYALPMSFGHDRTRDRCVFQFAFGEESLKADYISEGNMVSLSVYKWEDVDDWRSVVVRGDLEPIDGEAVPEAAGIFASFANIASPAVFRQPLEALEFEWYALHIREKRGRES